MCVIINIPAKKTLSKKLLENCYNTNPHGWGIMFAKHGKLVTVKDVSNFNNFWKIWHEIPRDTNRAVHFRIKTHGAINKENCHPFLPSDKLGLMHNGIIDTALIKKEMSDTYNFCEFELKPLIQAYSELNQDCLEDKAFKDLMKELAGYSKLLFMDSSGKTTKVNENLWVSRYGCDFSNGNSLDIRSTAIYSSSRSSSNLGRYWDHDTKTWKDYKDRYNHNNNVYDDEYYMGEYGDMGYNPAHAGHIKTVHSHTHTSSGFSNSPSIIENSERDKYSVLKDLENNDANEQAEKYIQEKLAQGQLPELLDDKDDLPQSEEIYDESGEDVVLNVEEILSQEENDLLDFVQDYPKAAAMTLIGLADACQRAGIKEGNYQYNDNSSSKRSAVNT